MKGLVVFVLLETITIAQGLCNFPSDLVGKSFNIENNPFVYKFEATKYFIQENIGGVLVTTGTVDCREQNGDIFVVEGDIAFLCLKYILKDGSTPQAIGIGLIKPKPVTGIPNLCDVCAARLTFNQDVFRGKWIE
ncbi:Hypothetical predicted protein [Mytilus galloprovincialis]|uniref:Uncharacterized protein n=1 Tax=Mytilus galloprovincialis TaxID=29158 RepID=A0A8B6H5Z2_MYTGA|nr:Hypothetical predicted protein [Mytilus galloprovincialis]